MTALLGLGRRLQERGYSFVTVTPATHARVLATRSEAKDLRDLFGWNLPASPALLASLDPELRPAEAFEGARARATVRYSSLGSGLFVHSGFPTTARDAVFFGPDTYRFISFLRRVLSARPRARRLVEIGCGSGAAAIACADRADEICAGDINPRALELTAVNAALNGVRVDIRHSDVLAGFDGEFDLVIANPPYLVDDDARLYRDGGGALGLDLPLRIIDEGAARLSPGGLLAMYCGTPVIDGRDPLLAAVLSRFPDAVYEELDPDVFGEELARPAYAAADRIAVVGICITR